MKPIVCATRGGEACRRTQERAIQLAKEQNAELIFLYAADPGIVGPVDESLHEALKKETSRLGTALLHMAQARAEKQGLTAQTLVLQGPAQESIIEYLQELGAGTLVLGAPRSGAAPAVFTSEGIRGFADTIGEETEMDVVIVT